MIFGPDGDTGVELETKLHDAQAQTRRLFGKWRDSGAQRLLLIVADTAANRRVLRELPAYFTELPRLKTGTVINELEAGHRPKTGLVLL
jgi:hypothetical protein